MGARGPAATPLKVLQARGSKQSYKRKGEPVAPSGAPPWPEGWPESRRPIWDRLVASLSSMDILSSADAGCIENFVIACERRNLADEALRDGERYEVNSHGNSVPRPEILELDRAIDLMTKVGAKLGLSPADRAAVRGAQVAKPVVDSKARFFAG